jgi:hypothetical protein
MKWLLAALAISSPVLSADIMSPSISIEHAKAMLAARGGVGTIFADGDNRYLISRIEPSGTLKRNVFTIEIEITPLPKHVGATN